MPLPLSLDNFLQVAEVLQLIELVQLPRIRAELALRRVDGDGNLLHCKVNVHQTCEALANDADLLLIFVLACFDQVVNELLGK